MACYIVTFDADGVGASEAIKAKLKSFGHYCPITSSSWAIVTELPAIQIRDLLAQVSPDSRFFVVRSGTESAWRHPFGTANTEWLKKYL